MALRVKLHKIRLSSYAQYFDVNEFVDLDKFIEGVITVPQGRAQIVNIKQKKRNNFRELTFIFLL